MPIEVTVVTDRNDRALEPLWASIDTLLRFWDEHYSQTKPHSEVLALNRRSAAAVAVSVRLGRMIADALAYGDSTAGGFDPTILPVKELWGLGEIDTVHHVPSAAELAATLRKVGYRNVGINPGRDTVRFAAIGVTIDAGGFAKGYALIETGKLLDSLGFHRYLVAAGDLVAKGRRSDGKPWRIGIQHPRADRLLATVTLDTGAVFTSGDYENYWMDGNRRIHHLFNPRTGCSCTGNQSLTIRSDSPLQAKYLSTGLFCRPADSILAYVERRGLDCVVVDSAGKIFISHGWKNKVVLAGN